MVEIVYLPEESQNGCNLCLDMTFEACADFLEVNGLPANMEMNWSITDKFNNQFSGIIASDNAGRVLVPRNEMTEGFNQHSGTFKLVFTDNANTPIDITVGSETYNCITFQFVNA